MSKLQTTHVGALKSSRALLHSNRATTVRSHSDNTYINVSTLHSTGSMLELAILTEKSSVLTKPKSNFRQEFSNDDLAAKYDVRGRKFLYAIYVSAELRRL